MYLKLSNGLYFFGVGGCIRVIPIPSYEQKAGFKTELKFQTGYSVSVKETVEEIESLLIGEMNE